LGYLLRLARISGVSGGAIVTGLLGARWGNLAFRDGVAENFSDVVVGPIRKLANRTIDISSALVGLLPGRSGAEKLASEFEDALFGKTSLQELSMSTRGRSRIRGECRRERNRTRE
jgi:NTE family protein